MYISTDKIVSVTEANRNFSKVAKMVNDKKEIVIMKNNKPRYVMLDYEEYESRKESGMRVSDYQADYGSPVLIDNVEQVTEDGMVKLPDNIQKALNVQKSGKVTFIEDNGKVSLMSPSMFALRKLQIAMEGQAEELGLKSIDDVVKMIKEVRRELWEELHADND